MAKSPSLIAFASFMIFVASCQHLVACHKSRGRLDQQMRTCKTCSHVRRSMSSSKAGSCFATPNRAMACDATSKLRIGSSTSCVKATIATRSFPESESCGFQSNASIVVARPEPELTVFDKCDTELTRFVKRDSTEMAELCSLLLDSGIPFVLSDEGGYVVVVVPHRVAQVALQLLGAAGQ